MTQDMQDEARREWQQLGFYFDYDESLRRWLVVGSLSGLQKFCKILIDYANKSKHVPLSEHEHYGPYQDLKLVTWHSPEIRRDGIYGRLADFVRLATIVEDALRSGATAIEVGQLYVEAGEGADDELEICVAPPDFVPEAADAAIIS